MAPVLIEYRVVISLALAGVVGSVGLHLWPFRGNDPLLALIEI